MKVLMLSWEYTPHIVGGLGKHVVEIVPELVAAGVEVHLVVPNLGGGASYRAAPPAGWVARDKRQPGLPGGCLGNAERLLHKHLARQHSRDRVLPPIDKARGWLRSDPRPRLVEWLRGNRSEARLPLPLLATIHATEMGRNRGDLYGEMQRSIHQAEWWLTYEAWRVIACSQYMAWEVETYFGAPQAKIDVIPNGVDPRPFDALRGHDLSQFRLAFAQPDQPIVYYVGRMVPEKGLSVLVDAVPLVLREWPGVKFVIGRRRAGMAKT